LTGCAPHPPRFYFGRDIGSESQFNPLTQIVNEGFDYLRTSKADRHVLSRDYATGIDNVFASLGSAPETFRTYGWDRVVRNEWLPLTTQNGAGGGAWVPNYEYHLIGSGMVSVRMEEWFAQHGVGHPAVMSAATIMASHLLNEVIENGAQRLPNEDAATDLLLFDPAGLILWRLPAVQRFFSGPLQFTNWPGQASFDVSSRTLENAGQQYVLRAPLPYLPQWKLFYDFGMSTLLGVSHVRPNGDGISVGLGGDVVDNPVVDSRTGAKSATLKFKGGFFYDRNGSLLFSVLVGSHADITRVNANLYPGIVRIGPFDPGLWLQLPGSGGVRAGIATRLGIGAGHGPKR